MRRIIIPIMVLLAATGCQVTEDLTVKEGGAVSSSTDIHVEQFFIDVLEDFAEFLPAEDESMMESAISGYASGLENTEAITAASWESLGDNRYSVAFDCSSVQELLSQMGAENQTLFVLDDHSISFSLDMENYQELKAVVPFLADPNFEVYGPEYNQGMSEADYLDMIYFLLGEDGPDAVANGVVEVSITVPGTITDAEGCKVTGTDTASFRFPIIDFLLLNEPLAFSIEWE